MCDCLVKVCFTVTSNIKSTALQTDLSMCKAVLLLWTRQWPVTFNPLKTEAVLFTLKKINILPQLIFDNIPINFVDSHKHLGVTFSSTGQWHTHIENIVLSATKILGIMRKLKYPQL